LNIEQIRRAVQASIVSVAPEADPQRIRPDQPLREQVDLDSLDWLNVIASLRERLSIEIPDADSARLATLDSIIAYIASGQASHSGATSRATAQVIAPLPCTQHVVKGIPVTVRPIRPDDRPLEADFVRHLSTETRYGRFMVALHELPAAKLKDLTDVDQVGRVALVATVDRDGQEVMVGGVRYAVDPTGTRCEFAVAVDDAWQGSGLAGILMLVLMDVARSRGLGMMEGLVLATNTRMLKFTHQLGFALQHDPEDRQTVRVVRSL